MKTPFISILIRLTGKAFKAKLRYTLKLASFEAVTLAFWVT